MILKAKFYHEEDRVLKGNQLKRNLDRTDFSRPILILIINFIVFNF